MDDIDLPTTVDDVFEICPKLRVLVLGRTGAGKTTLIKRAFGVDTLQGSDNGAGVCNIGDEIVSPDNSRFVVHDSQGFEPGERKNFDTVKHFIENRHLQTQLPEKLHAIWHCIKTPHANGRVLEVGDEKFLWKKTSLEVIRGVPIIVVFTQYDTLPGQVEYDLEDELQDLETEEEVQSLVQRTSQDIFEQSCVGPIRRINSDVRCVKVSSDPDYKDTLEELVQLTTALIRDNLDKTAWLVSAAAQRLDVNDKVTASVEIGTRKYWRKLSSKSSHFSGRTLRQCFDTIYSDVIKGWNLRDPHLILLGNTLKARLLHLVQDMRSNDGVLGQFVRQDVEVIKVVLDTTQPSGPGGSRVTPLFNDWLFGYYQPNPGTLRSLMGFIVNLILMLERLFWVMYREGQVDVTLDLIEAAFQEYDLEKREKVHAGIREYVDNFDYSRPDEAHVEVKHLIESNRVARDMGKKGPSVTSGVAKLLRRIWA